MTKLVSRVASLPADMARFPELKGMAPWANGRQPLLATVQQVVDWFAGTNLRYSRGLFLIPGLRSRDDGSM
jgi:hypothetical protein